jgi:hypothetical protein
VQEKLLNMPVFKGQIKRPSLLDRNQRQQITRKIRQIFVEIGNLSSKYASIKMIQMNPSPAPLPPSDLPPQKAQKVFKRLMSWY